MKTCIEKYSDKFGNEIKTDVVFPSGVVEFNGKNNKVYIEEGANIKDVKIIFAGDNGVVKIGSGGEVRLMIRVGFESSVIVGHYLTCTSICYITAVEGSMVEIGDDCMFASANELRSDDGHPIFDMATGERINWGGTIKIGNHVWLGARSVVLGNSIVGDGSVIGHSAIVKSNIPESCIAVGIPARVIRKGIRWERPHLSKNKIFKKNKEL